MATWGEFIAEIPIINKRSEGIFVKADHVLDLWEERNRLRAELATLKNPSAEAEAPGTDEAPMPLAAPVTEESNDAAAQERERCAQEIEEFAQTCPVDPAWREWAVQLLQTAAQLLREKPKQDADFLAQVVIPPPAQAETTNEEAPPMAEPVDDEMPPMAEPVEEGRSTIPHEQGQNPPFTEAQSW